ncbi:MAG TPA: site-specific integrase [Gemmatimonadales bacterium]|nr:site-specific integrase [Gemmatimonadales bacterium]
MNWRALRPSWAPSAASWNHLRRAVLTFLTAHLGDVDHPFRKAVRKAFGTLEREVHRVPDLTPDLFWMIVRAAPLHAQSCFVALVATGLRVGEFLRLRETDLLPHTFSVKVPGTKTAASAATVRVDAALWPWVKAAVPSPLAYKWLRLYWKRALKSVGADTTLRLHDLRHAHGQWAVNAGVPEAAVQASLRHANRAMTARYTAQRDRGTVASALAEVLLPQSVPLSAHPAHAKGA